MNVSTSLGQLNSRLGQLSSRSGQSKSPQPSTSDIYNSVGVEIGTNDKCQVPSVHAVTQDILAEILALRQQVVPDSSCESSDISRLSSQFDEQSKAASFTHHVAYVEDNFIMTITHKSAFTQTGMQAICYPDGESFLADVENNAVNPKALLMDFSLGIGKLDGSEVIAHIKANGYLPDTVIIGYSNAPESHPEFMNAGANDTILKDGIGLRAMTDALRLMMR
jgi:hypothetical protein